MTQPELPLSLHLFPDGTDLPVGTPIATLEGGSGRLELGKEGATLHLSLPPLSRSEIRFWVERTLALLDGVIKTGDIRVLGQGVDNETLLTIALDLHNRSGGRALVADNAAVFAQVQRIGALEDLYRSWVNEDPTTRTSIAIATDIGRWSEECEDVSVTVLDEDMLRERGLNLLLTVGQGSESSPSRLLVASYRPKGKEQAPMALVGKGITFDTGGINVKPYESFVSMMKNDMAGAALAYALFRGLVESDYEHPLLLVIPTCENAIGARAMRPGTVVKSYAGKTVRIDHTDAEGRLILADALAYAEATYHPREFLCFATLTTAALNAYGPYATPVHFAEKGFHDNLERAAGSMGEDFHFFPKRLWHQLANGDQEADLRNTARLPGKASQGAGSRNAAHFLAEFSSVPLCHLDIFASTWNWSEQAPGGGVGATGAPLRSLLWALNPPKELG